MNKLLEYLPYFMDALAEQLEDDFQRWGNTWLTRPIEGQSERTVKTLRDYFDQYEQAGIPINWLKIAGNALICWVRETYYDTTADPRKKVK